MFEPQSCARTRKTGALILMPRKTHFVVLLPTLGLLCQLYVASFLMALSSYWMAISVLTLQVTVSYLWRWSR